MHMATRNIYLYEYVQASCISKDAEGKLTNDDAAQEPHQEKE